MSEEEKSKSVYELKLHETTHLDTWSSVLRVPGGWIYQFTCPPDEGTDFGVFVPYVEEEVPK